MVVEKNITFYSMAYINESIKRKSERKSTKRDNIIIPHVVKKERIKM